jgi:hypothetical protein
MKGIEYISSVLVLLFIVLINGCTEYPALQEPDMDRFNQTVQSPALRDSLLVGKLTPGMPYFIASQLFEDWTPSIMEKKIPVASLGSKQRLEEVEGWGRDYVDPDIKVFLDKYETEKGKLYVWYQRPDFYTLDVSARDTFCIFLEDTVICSVIKYLNKSSVLTIRDSLPQVSRDTNVYAEIRYNDHPWRKSSYWYDLKILSNSRTFKIKDLNFEIYPIELLEFNGEPVSSFNWR